jgi:hypothetical protein
MYSQNNMLTMLILLFSHQQNGIIYVCVHICWVVMDFVLILAIL